MDKVYSSKSKTTAALLGMFFGTIGVMDFYVGRVKSGIIKFLLMGTLFGTPISIIWNIVNIFGVASESYTDSENRPLAGDPGAAKIMAIIALVANLLVLVGAIVMIMKIVNIFAG